MCYNSTVTQAPKVVVSVVVSIICSIKSVYLSLIYLQ